MMEKWILTYFFGRYFHPILAIFRSWIFFYLLTAQLLRIFENTFWDFLIRLCRLRRKGGKEGID